MRGALRRQLPHLLAQIKIQDVLIPSAMPAVYATRRYCTRQARRLLFSHATMYHLVHLGLRGLELASGNHVRA